MLKQSFLLLNGLVAMVAVMKGAWADPASDQAAAISSTHEHMKQAYEGQGACKTAAGKLSDFKLEIDGNVLTFNWVEDSQQRGLRFSIGDTDQYSHEESGSPTVDFGCWKKKECVKELDGEENKWRAKTDGRLQLCTAAAARITYSGLLDNAGRILPTGWKPPEGKEKAAYEATAHLKKIFSEQVGCSKKGADGKFTRIGDFSVQADDELTDEAALTFNWTEDGEKISMLTVLKDLASVRPSSTGDAVLFTCESHQVCLLKLLSKTHERKTEGLIPACSTSIAKTLSDTIGTKIPGP